MITISMKTHTRVATVALVVAIVCAVCSDRMPEHRLPFIFLALAVTTASVASAFLAEHKETSMGTPMQRIAWRPMPPARTPSTPATTIPLARTADDQRRNDAQGLVGMLDVFLAYIENPQAFDTDQLRINIEQAKAGLLK